MAPVNFVVSVSFQEVESNADDCKQFAQMCQEAVKKFDCPGKKALDVMCSVGRFSYELSKFLEEVPYPPAVPYGTRLYSSTMIDITLSCGGS